MKSLFDKRLEKLYNLTYYIIIKDPSRYFTIKIYFIIFKITIVLDTVLKKQRDFIILINVKLLRSKEVSMMPCGRSYNLSSLLLNEGTKIACW